MDCLFCKIINGDIPSYKIYEDDDFLAFLDISQATKGHTLVLPKKHFANILEMDDETAKKLLIVIRNVSKKIKDSLNADGINILNNCGEKAGQTINHLHFHILPRYTGDNLTLDFKDNSKSLDLKEIQELINR